MREAKRSSSRARLLEATEQSLREAGMSGTGIKDVVIRSGAPIGSLYHYFPNGKTQLVAESLTIHAAKSRRLLERFFDRKRSAADAVRSLFNTAADGFEQAGAHKACAIGTVTLDLTPSDKEIRDICRKTFDQWIAIIAPTLPFSDERSRRSFATMVVVALEGAFVLGKATESGDPFRDTGEWLAAMVSSGKPARVRRKRRGRGSERSSK